MSIIHGFSFYVKPPYLMVEAVFGLEAPIPLVLETIAAVIIPAFPCTSVRVRMQRDKSLISLEDEILVAAVRDLSPESV